MELDPETLHMWRQPLNMKLSIVFLTDRANNRLSLFRAAEPQHLNCLQEGALEAMESGRWQRKTAVPPSVTEASGHRNRLPPEF